MSMTEDSSSLKFQLGNMLREALDRAANSNSRSLGQEIRGRLYFSFDLDRDSNTRQLVMDLLQLANAIALDVGQAWHSSERARLTFAAAVSDRIINHKASDAAAGKKDAELDASAKQEATITGRTIARMLRKNPIFSSGHKYDYEFQELADRLKSALSNTKK